MLRKIAAFFFIVTSSSAHAQAPGEAPFKPEDFGITKQSKFYKQFEQTDDGGEGEEEAVPAIVSVGVIIERVEREEGIPMPKLVKPIERTAEMEAKVKQAVESNMKVLTDRTFYQKELPNCSSNKTTKFQGMGFGKLEQGTLIADILYIRKSSMPEDPTEVFGPTVQIREYEPDPKSVNFNTALGMGVICLPYRIRITDSFTEKHEGKNALRNYSKDQLGKGFLHREAKKIDF